MNRRAIRILIFAIALLAAYQHLQAQVATGIYPLGTFDNLGFDTVNVGNLNTHFAIPVLNKPGRGMPFYYNLSYDSAVWAPANSGNGLAWTFAQSAGWRGDTEITTGYVQINIGTSHTRILGSNPVQYCTITTYAGFSYHDPFGVAHAFPLVNTRNDSCSPDESISTGNATASDGSGYSINVTNYDFVTITGSNGRTFHPPSNINSGPGTVTDNNGNQITTDGAGHFIDTLGKNVLTVNTTATPQTYTYTDTNGNLQQVAVNYSNYTVQTAFGCSGITDYPATATTLISSIAFPDGTTYRFTYEPTPGVPTNTTGRLASVTLPQGGTISYSYSGANNGISCATGSPNVLTRKLTNDPANSTRVYTLAVNGTTSTTTVQDGLSNKLIYNFISPSGVSNTAGPIYETQRQIYNGTGGTAVLNQLTCYNGNTNNCQGTQPAQPFSQIDTYATVDGSVTNGTTLYYDTYGNKTGEIDYDYGTGGTRGSALQYNYYQGYGTQAYVSLPTSNYTADGNGHLTSYTTYAYDQTTPNATSGLPQHIAVGSARGNLTTVTKATAMSGGSSASTTYTYDDAGQVLTSADPAGNVTSYTYDATYDAYLTQTTYPTVNSVTQTSKAAYDFNTGLATTTWLNGQPTTYTYDAMLRPLKISFPDGGQSQYTYNLAATPATSTVATLHAGTTSIAQTTTYDPYGRTQQTSLTDDANPDLVNYTYDANSNLASVTNPYRSGAAQYVTSGSYDVLGRLLIQTQADCSGGTCSKKSWAPLGNTVTITDEAGNQHEQFTDGIGRITKVLEPNPTGSKTPLLETDYLYNQNYNTATNQYQTIVNQKGGSSTPSSLWRTRTFTYDMLGHLVSSSEPESGLISYSYGPVSVLCAGNIALPCTRTDARGVVTTYTYDALSRPTGISYHTSGTVAASTPTVAYYYDQASYNGLTITNGTGNRTGMTDASGTTAFSFDTMNRVNGIRKSIGSATAQATYTYNLDGTVNTLTDFAGTTLTYTYTSAGLPKSVSDSAGHTYASAAQYNAAGQLTNLNHQYNSSGATFTRQLGYNARLQPNSIAATANGTTIQSLSIGYPSPGQNNGNVLSITNGLNSTRSQSYSYDNLNRLTAGGDASHWGEQYTYDPWGNMTQLTLTQGSGNAFSVTANNANQLSNLTYDASGNVTHDQFGNSIAYNAESRVASSGSATYTYDGDGNRVIKTNSAGTTLYWPSPVTGILDESNSTATAFAPQVYLGGLKVWSSDTAGNGRFLFPDHLGSTRVTANAAGSVLDDIDYRSFGSVAANYGSAQSDNHYLFTGYESDAADTSTDYATFRNQSYTLGRFTRPDPYLGSYDTTNPQSFNRYAYTLNNPLAWTDPTGLDYIDENGNLCYDPTDPNDLSTGAVVCDGYGLIFGTQHIVMGGGGGGGRNPSISPNYSNADVCTADSLLHNGVALGLDVLGIEAGFLPEGGSLSENLGAPSLSTTAGLASSFASAANSRSQNDRTGTALGLGSYGLGVLQWAGEGLDAAKAFPVVGIVVSGISFARDLNQAGKDYDKCMSEIQGHP